MKRILITLAVSLSLAGCDSPASVPIRECDQCMREQIFKECLALVPKGPERTTYNDWYEVVSECESAAYWQSLRRVENIKPECR